MANVTYTVQSGDTLSGIAKKYNTTWQILASINNIENEDLIHTGQVLILPNDDGTIPPAASTTNNSNMAVIQNFGLQSTTDRTVFATWLWTKSNTDNYRAVWDYYVDGIWFNGSDSYVDKKESIYNAPKNAIHVRFRVVPISKTKTVNKKETHYWYAEWSTYETYSFSDNPPSKPAVPKVTVKDYKLTAVLDKLADDATAIQFQVVKDHSTIFKTSLSTIHMGYVQYSCYLDIGSEYKVRCRAYRDEMYSDWTEYSDVVTTKPGRSYGFTSYRAKSETSVYLEWGEVSNATTYDIEYAKKRDYFDGSNQTTTISDIKFTHYEITGLDTGTEYFFRVRASNDQGDSDWAEIISITIGKTPSAPTTWSSTTTCIAGEKLVLYWVHNAEDGSTQKSAELQIYINGQLTTEIIDTSNEEDDEKTMHYDVVTSSLSEGATIKWRVRTAGVTGDYSDWSIERSVNVYAPPTVALEITDVSGDTTATIRSLPFYISAKTSPDTQTPIEYHVSVVSNDTYETLDNMGNRIIVKAGEEIYSKHFATSFDLLLEMTAGDISLANNITYTVNCTVSMSSGLTADAHWYFNVAWTDVRYHPNAEILLDRESLTTSIRPYCEDENGELIDGVTLSVYRREFDGSFTELGSDIPNMSYTFVSDPHPALDYARYRVVAKTDATGALSYYDVPGYPVEEKSIIIQWNEHWTNFDTTNEDAMHNPSWSGSMLKLPYNVDVADNYAPDASLVKYIGRNRPVSYYGTQLGETSTWNVAIEKSDSETLYALRRLGSWIGDVYVREPSGSGYWANISVSFSQKHLALTIPVSLTITRVEGGA